MEFSTNLPTNLVESLKGKTVMFQGNSVKVLERKKNITGSKTSLFLMDIKRKSYISSLFPPPEELSLSPDEALIFEHKGEYYILRLNLMKIEALDSVS